MSIKKILDERGILLPEFIEGLKERSRTVSCECPEHLIALFDSVKAFTKYQEDCLIEKPHDETVHKWLKSSSINMEHFLSATITSLSRMEGIIDNDNNFVD
jgi:hypothetical protein